MAIKFILKTRTVTAAKRNPFRPRQTCKHGPWRTITTFESVADAVRELRDRTRGMADHAVFFKGERITNEHKMLSAFWQQRFQVDSVGMPRAQSILCGKSRSARWLPPCSLLIDHKGSCQREAQAMAS